MTKSKFFIAAALAVASFASAAAIVTAGELTRGAYEYTPTVTTVTDAYGNLKAVNAGAMNATFDDGTAFGDSFLMYCVDLFSPAGAIGAAHTYDKVDYVNSLNPYDKIAKLVTANGGLGNVDASGSAAMQLAIWNVLYDNDLTVDSGTFRAFGTTGTGVNAKANSLLSAANGLATSSYEVSLLTDNAYTEAGKATRQDYITASTLSRCNKGDCGPVTNVPEPSRLALMFAGLLALGFVGVRRKTS